VSGRSGSPRWTRTGSPQAFRPTTDGTETEIGWTWEIRRPTNEQRIVRVEVTRVPFVVTDLPEEARHAIRSRGATAVDAFLHKDDPPERIFVSRDGVHARRDPPHPTGTPF
jgi:hypothetical protein